MAYRLPTVLFYATWATIIAAPVVLAGLILNGAFAPEAIKAAFPHVPVSDAQSVDEIICAGVVGLAPWAIALWVLYQAQALFGLYRDGKALTRDAAHRIFQLGLGLVLVAITAVLARTAQILILTWANEDGTRMLAVSFGFTHVALLLAAGLMTIIGRSMIEAADAVDDMRGIV
ncbi:hypothetical protein [Marivita hallyeonensis]|uniref:DUF2975 domain-containing protein n=1 Tax=Marivita hallyeonensis TaxID=996342 RepID=A0A1M5XZ90_9RHOB|nr:hypothetical protein [Marivita hallyeonensis]SHI04593.1 hypothetical protein SAMN05443551_4195 [Marivita hallyeonensis]